jgi:glycosyltransferase involved in cell wall biosynthesis
VGLIVKRETKKPLVVTVHGYDILVEPSVDYGIRLDKRYDSIVRKVLDNADIVITESNAVFEETCKIVKKTSKIWLVPNGVDIKRFRPNLDCAFLIEKLNLEGRTVIFALRAHEPKYGLEYLIRAAPIVVKHANDAIFVIAGDGSLRGYHEKLAATLGVQRKMIFTGRIQQNEVPYYYALSDIVVVPSLQEAFGLVVSEAMACSKPVVGTKVGGIPDQVIEGYNGFLVQPKNPSEIAEKITWLIKNPREAKLMGSNGRKIVEEKFDANKRTDRIIQLYSSLCNRSADRANSDVC